MKTDIQNEIDESALLKLVSESVLGMKGVTQMALEAEGLRSNILVRDTFIKDGVKLTKDKEGNITFDVYIRVVFGTKIPQLAWELQRKIQEDILSSSGLTINDINIHVEGVDLGDGNEQN